MHFSNCSASYTAIIGSYLEIVPDAALGGASQSFEGLLYYSLEISMAHLLSHAQCVIEKYWTCYG